MEITLHFPLFNQSIGSKTCVMKLLMLFPLRLRDGCMFQSICLHPLSKCDQDYLGRIPRNRQGFSTKHQT